jgi:hypothetical protein
VGIVALGGSGVGPALAAGDEGGETLVVVFDDGVAGGELALFLGEGHWSEFFLFLFRLIFLRSE